ncbi:hypothetical protein A9C19_02375 [Bacillus weihaiensis]|uniref:Uncharacterized protein n=1 Tax=Bacillus weihaiensis TaxID=1547283 RepID=A0A1L3MMW6_9BACI|nr:hypothetical protein A9C19_02375 [Bacillus weihaiensis]
MINNVVQIGTEVSVDNLTTTEEYSLKVGDKMKIKKEKKRSLRNVLKNMFTELRDSIFFEIAWNMLLYIPRVLIRGFKDLF